MKILITGGGGYIGCQLVPELLRKGHQVTVLDLFWFGDFLEGKNLKKIKSDVRSIREVDLTPYDIIFHFASVANDPCTSLDPALCWDISVTSTIELADHAVRSGVKRIIYASSGSVYGVQEVENVTEELMLVPLTVYNKAKIACERIWLSYSKNLDVQIVRPATVCGLSTRMRFDVVVNMLTIQALKNRKISVLGGDQYRPNIHIMDLVNVYTFLLDKPELVGIYNAGFENIKVIELAQKIASKIDCEIEIKPSNDKRSYRVSSQKLLECGFSPNYSIDTAIKEIAEAYNAGKIKESAVNYNVDWMRFLMGEGVIGKTS